MMFLKKDRPLEQFGKSDSRHKVRILYDKCSILINAVKIWRKKSNNNNSLGSINTGKIQPKGGAGAFLLFLWALCLCPLGSAAFFILAGDNSTNLLLSFSKEPHVKKSKKNKSFI